MREYFFDAILVVAANVLAGRQLSGSGLGSLRACARRNSFTKFEQDGTRITYRWLVSPQLSASEKLIRIIRAVGMIEVGCFRAT